MKFNENRSKGSGEMERTRTCYGRTDGLTDEGHSYNHLPFRDGGLTKYKNDNGLKKLNF